MPLEIERRFLVSTMPWEHITHGLHTKQGYIHRGQNCLVRIRIQHPYATSSTLSGNNLLASTTTPKDRQPNAIHNGIYLETLLATVENTQAFLTIKGPKHGISCAEYEYPLPPQDARELLELCPNACVEKIRYPFTLDGVLWEIDVFLHANAGLIIAEATLQHAEQALDIPTWAGEEISHETRYSNVKLAENPYKLWTFQAV